MRELLYELKYLITEHFYVENKFDLTIILNQADTMSLLREIDLGRYDVSSLSNDKGEYFYISSLVEGTETELYVESIYAKDGSLKDDVGNVAIIPHYISEELTNALCENDYNLVLQVSEESTYDEIIEII